MSITIRCLRTAPAIFALALGASVLTAPAQAAVEPATAKCLLGTPEHPIKHIIFLQFDNVHLRRDNPNVPSDLEAAVFDGKTVDPGEAEFLIAEAGDLIADAQ
jgi:hypothetical protein